jgi:hypothetical protein
LVIVNLQLQAHLLLLLVFLVTSLMHLAVAAAADQEALVTAEAVQVVEAVLTLKLL